MTNKYRLQQLTEAASISTASLTPATTYSVYYRTGGRDNCTWRVVLERHTTSQAAYEKCQELGRAGYKALYTTTESLQRNGLPEGWE